MPKTAPSPTLVIQVRGGNIQDIRSSVPIGITLIDWDDASQDKELLKRAKKSAKVAKSLPCAPAF